MGKRSCRRPARPQRDNFGCMRGLISFFDFRRGHHAQKLLSDKKNGSIKNADTGRSRVKLDSLRSFHDKHGVNLVDEIRQDQVNLCVTSVKALMEAEISQDRKTKVASDKAQRVTSNLQNGVHLKKISQKKSKKLSVDLDCQVNKLVDSSRLDGHQSDSIDFTERLSLKFDLAAFLIELYSYTCQEFHSDSNNKFPCLPTSGSIGTNIYNHLDEIDDHLDQKISFFQRILADVAQAIICQNSMVENQLNKQCIVHSTEFMDALDTLNSDKELFMKLLQDPNSLLLKHIQGLQCSQVGKLPKQESYECLEDAQKLRDDNDSRGKSDESDSNQLFQKQNRCNFFRKKDKTKPPGECTSSEDPVRIVILKPSSARRQDSSITSTSGFSPQSHCILVRSKEREKNSSHFSLKEIKRRLRHVIGESRKAQKVISMDGILHKIPVRSNKSTDTCKLMSNESSTASSATNSYYQTKNLPHSLSIDSRKFEKISSEECQARIKDHISSSRSESFIYEEAKKHLSEMLDARVNTLPRVHISESLERVISLPRCIELYPRSGPGIAKEPTMLHPKTGDPSLQHLPKEDSTATLSPSETNLELSSCSLNIPSVKPELLILKPEPVDNSMQEKSCITEDSTCEGSTEFEGAVVTKSIVAHNQFDVPFESSGNELTGTNEMCEDYKEEEYHVLQGLGSSEEESQTVTESTYPPSSLIGEILVASESTTERPEQPSPVSVLEAFLSEDSTSPASDADGKRPRQLNFEDHDNYPRTIASPDVKDKSTIYLPDTLARSSYIETVLEASGLTNKFSERWEMADQLLEPSLFHEVEAFFCFLQDDAKLLFDCINEVLAEINERFLKCTPRLSFINQKVLPAPRGERLIQEVSKAVERHLHILLPNTLNQVIRKDLDCRSWMDLQRETANVTSEMYDSILDDILEETIYDLWF